MSTLLKLLFDNPTASLLGLGALVLFIKGQLKGNTPDALGKLLEAAKGDARLEQHDKDLQAQIADTSKPVTHTQTSPEDTAKNLDKI